MNGTVAPHRILQHAFPFVMLDAVYDVEIGMRGKGRTFAAADHFLSRGLVFPQSLLLEAAAQLSGIVSGRERGGMFAGMKDVVFRRPVRTGERIEFTSALNGTFGGLFSFSVSAACGEETVMEGEIYLAMA